MILNYWNYFLKLPGQIAVLGLPSPLGVEQIGSTVLITPKPFIQKYAISRLIQRIVLVIPHPVPFKHITRTPLLTQEVHPFDLAGPVRLQPHESLRSSEELESPRCRSIVQVEEGADDAEGHDKEAQNAHRRLEQPQPLQPLQELRNRSPVGGGNMGRLNLRHCTEGRKQNLHVGV